MSETFAEPAADDAGAAAPAETAPDSGPVESAAAPAWSPDDPAFIDAVQATASELLGAQLEPLVPLLQQLAAGGQPQPGPQPFDPSQLVDEFGNLNPASFAQYLASERQQTLAEMQQMLQGIAQPLHARQEAETVAHGEERLKDIIADEIARNGEFSTKPEADNKARQLVRTLADQMFPEVAQRYGSTPRAAEMAIARASATVRELLAEERNAAVAAHVDRNARLAGVHGEPGTVGLSAVEGSRDTPYQPGELARKYGVRAQGLRSA